MMRAEGSMAFEKELAQDIAALYARSGFGKASKSELDQAVFHYLLLNKLPKKFVKDGKPRYFHVDKSAIYELSIELKITEARVKALLEADYLASDHSCRIEDLLLETVNSATIRKGTLKEGKIRFLAPNPITRKFLEERIYSVGGMADSSFNREILVLEIYDFLRLVDFSEPERIRALIRKNILQKAVLAEKDPEMAAFLSELDKKPVEETLKGLACGLASKLIGKAGDEIVGAVLDGAKAALGS
jgi:hypothetical protein